MKLVKTASGKNKIKMSRREWTDLGKKAGWAEELDYGSRPGAEEATRALKLLNSLKEFIQELVVLKERSPEFIQDKRVADKYLGYATQGLLKPLSQCNVLSAESRKYYSSWLDVHEHARDPLYHFLNGTAGLMEKINQDISTLERDTQAPTEEANLLNADWSGAFS